MRARRSKTPQCMHRHSDGVRCIRSANYGDPDINIVQFCFHHKNLEDVDISGLTCQYPVCGLRAKHPSSEPQYCSKHLKVLHPQFKCPHLDCIRLTLIPGEYCYLHVQFESLAPPQSKLFVPLDRYQNVVVCGFLQ